MDTLKLFQRSLIDTLYWGPWYTFVLMMLVCSFYCADETERRMKGDSYGGQGSDDGE